MTTHTALPLYNTFIIDLSAERTTEDPREIAISGQSIVLFSSGSMTGVQLAIDTPVNGWIPVSELGESIYYPIPFQKIYLAWTAQAGRYLRVFIGRQAAAGVGAASSDYLSKTQAVAEGRMDTLYHVPGIGLSFPTTHTLTSLTVYYEPFIVSSGITVNDIAINVTTLAAGASAILGIYEADRDWQPSSMVNLAGSVSVASIGVKPITINQSLSAGRYLKSMISDGAPTLRAYSSPTRGTGTAFAATVAVALSRAQAHFLLPDPPEDWNTVTYANASGIYHRILFTITP